MSFYQIKDDLGTTHGNFSSFEEAMDTAKAIFRSHPDVTFVRVGDTAILVRDRVGSPRYRMRVNHYGTGT
jgi:hypothetical protein